MTNETKRDFSNVTESLYLIKERIETIDNMSPETDKMIRDEYYQICALCETANAMNLDEDDDCFAAQDKCINKIEEMKEAIADLAALSNYLQSYNAPYCMAVIEDVKDKMKKVHNRFYILNSYIKTHF